jgi:hypothetical protein
MVCPTCKHDARFVEHRAKSWLTANGTVRHQRAYYHCDNCHRGHFPFDAANRLRRDGLSVGLRPLVCLAGTLAPFRDAASDILHRFAGVRIGASTARRVTEQEGARLAQRQRQDDVVVPVAAKPWDFTIEDHSNTAAYLGLDAFSVPMQGSKGAKAEGRMIYTAVLYSPNKQHSHYLVDFDLARLAAQMRQAALKLGLGRADRLIALTDAGNGLEEALRRNFDGGLLCILDWYHASQHLHDYAKAAYGQGEGEAWVSQAKSILYEQGGSKLLEHLRNLPIPKGAEAAEEHRKLLGYFSNNEHRTDYPRYKKQGWDIGSGPTEAACKIVGARLKGCGMRWAEHGAAEVAPLRALYHSGTQAWDAFFALAS